MRKTLVYDNSVSGHHLEYLHHIHERALQVASRERQFIFAVPEKFKERSRNLNWPKNPNISFVFFDVPENISGLKNCKNLGKIAKEQGATDVLLVALMGFLPWLPFFIPRGVKISGIIYMIYLYRWQKSSWKTKLLDALKYLFFKFCPNIERIFLLNDKIAPVYLNQLFKTQKFEFLPDPVAVDAATPTFDIRKEFGVPANARLFSHFGGLAARKGTLDILEMLAAFPQKFQNDYFFFTRVGADIRERFYELLKKARENGVPVIVKDEFVSYEFLKSLAAASTAILIPYHNTEQSSGLIAYAAATGVPVISPRGGLLGKLVNRYKLGVFLESPQSSAQILRERDLSTENVPARAIAIAGTLLSLDDEKLKFARAAIRGNDYLHANSLEEFQRILMP